jgi:protoporphyrinogen oxidase
VGKFHNFADKVSMAWLWARLNTRTNSKQAGKEMLGYIDGGFVTLIAKLEKEIKKLGGKIITKKAITGIQFNKMRKDYDKVVFTGPNGAFANLIKDELETEPKYIYDLKKTNYLGAICMVFTSSQSLSKYYWHNINTKDAPFLAFIQHTNLIDKENYGDKHVYYCGVYTPDVEQDVEKKWFSYLTTIFPKFNNKLVDQKWIFRLKNAQHVVTCDYHPMSLKTPLSQVYLMNFSQIFPQDRGTNFAVAEALKLATLF